MGGYKRESGDGYYVRMIDPTTGKLARQSFRITEYEVNPDSTDERYKIKGFWYPWDQVIIGKAGGGVPSWKGHKRLTDWWIMKLKVKRNLEKAQKEYDRFWK